MSEHDHVGSKRSCCLHDLFHRIAKHHIALHGKAHGFKRLHLVFEHHMKMLDLQHFQSGCYSTRFCN